MTLTIKKTCAQLVAEAEAEIETISAADAVALMDDPNCVFVDLRDVRELWREGRIPGSVHAPRGMLEFWIDPASPYHRDVFASGKRFVFHCSLGWRSALAAKAAQDMGLTPVCHIAGGYKAWREAGGAWEAQPRKAKS